MDMYGKSIKSEAKRYSIGKQIYEINTQEIGSNGNYLLKLTIDNQQFIKKFAIIE
jgi:hypothetical protein